MDKKISAIIIARNEEGCIEDMLKSIQWLDEICIMDTGSSDKTIEIARKYTDKVYQDTSFYKWTEWVDSTFDFWWARNKAKEYATWDFILSIDCDEKIITENWIERLKILVNSLDESVDAIQLELWNGGNQRLFNTRLFKRELDWQWRMHEVIIWKNTIKTDITIQYWTSPSHSVDVWLDTRILEEEHKITPDNTRIMFYLAREYMYWKRYKEAEDMFELYLEKSSFIWEKIEAYFLLSQCYWWDWQWNWEKARNTCIKAIQLNPYFKAAINLFAEMHYEPAKSRWLSFAEWADNSNLLYIH